ncbi:MAG TPA: hypothetical protein VFD92_12715 [Candidatus Binatia bacterium]|nr:hypothetical protein [Candidatus Binatia bacterium]
MGAMKSRALALSAAAGLLAVLAALDPPAARAGIGAGPGFGINLVRLRGVLGADRAPGHIMQTSLLVGDKTIPFSVVSAERISGVPEDGVGVLLPMGPGQPQIRAVGEPAFIKPLEDAPPGTEVTIIGNLITGMRYLELLGVDLPPSAGS